MSASATHPMEAKAHAVVPWAFASPAPATQANSPMEAKAHAVAPWAFASPAPAAQANSPMEAYLNQPRLTYLNKQNTVMDVCIGHASYGSKSPCCRAVGFGFPGPCSTGK